MPLHTLPNAFSITALLADQVALLARHQRLSPGGASLLLRQLMEARRGRQRLLRILEAELQRESNPVEAAKIAEVRSQTQAWVADLDRAAPTEAEDATSRGDADRGDGGGDGDADQKGDEPPATRAAVSRRHSAVPRPLNGASAGRRPCR